MIISLLAGGMTICDIQHHLAATLSTELSHETISNITEAVAGRSPRGSRVRSRRFSRWTTSTRWWSRSATAHVANRAAHGNSGVIRSHSESGTRSCPASERGRPQPSSTAETPRCSGETRFG